MRQAMDSVMLSCSRVVSIGPTAGLVENTVTPWQQHGIHMVAQTEAMPVNSVPRQVHHAM